MGNREAVAVVAIVLCLLAVVILTGYDEAAELFRPMDHPECISRGEIEGCLQDGRM